VGAAEGVDGDDRLAILQMLERVGDNDYQLGDHLDLPFLIGRMVYQLDEPDRAIQWYEGSLRQSGDHEATLFNIGLCHEAAGRQQEARAMFERALTIRPTYELAKQRLAEIR
jgi:tetratricopeptide (TPR) repeat protein